MTYYANFSANNGTCLREPIKDSNKQRIIKSIRDIAEAERFQGNECSWCVWVEDDRYEDGCRVLAKGGRCDWGRHRIY